MKDIAINYFKNGYSCSEAIIKAAVDKGLVNEALLPLATPFSGGMSSGCLCGAVAGAQLIIGAIFGRVTVDESPKMAKQYAAEIVSEFKARNKYTCCKALTAGLDMASPERKLHCCKIVADAADIIEDICIRQKNIV